MSKHSPIQFNSFIYVFLCWHLSSTSHLPGTRLQCRQGWSVDKVRVLLPLPSSCHHIKSAFPEYRKNKWEPASLHGERWLQIPTGLRHRFSIHLLQELDIDSFTFVDWTIMMDEHLLYSLECFNSVFPLSAQLLEFSQFLPLYYWAIILYISIRPLLHPAVLLLQAFTSMSSSLH